MTFKEDEERKWQVGNEHIWGTTTRPSTCPCAILSAATGGGQQWATSELAHVSTAPAGSHRNRTS